MSLRVGYFYILSLFIVSCIHDIEPEIPNEEELITTVKVVFTPTNGGEDKIFLFQDIDGDGGNEPVFQVDTLEANTLYNAHLELYNEQYSPALSITEEVEEEGQDHQFFFNFQSSNFQLQYDDEDVNGNPIGLQFQLQTQQSTQDVLNIILRHEPDKFAAGVSEGNIENAGGETDIELNFELYVE